MLINGSCRTGPGGGYVPAGVRLWRGSARVHVSREYISGDVASSAGRVNEPLCGVRRFHTGQALRSMSFVAPDSGMVYR